MCQAPTKAAALAVLSQYLWSWRDVLQRDLFGSEDMLHVCGSLFMFVHGDWFVNPRHDLACPAGGVYFWMTRQSGGKVGENIASTKGAITALDGANVRHEEVTSETRTKLAVVVGPMATATDMETHAYVLHSLLEGASLVTEATHPLVNWINWNQTEWVHLMAKQETTTRFSYNVSLIVLAYLNACILELTAVAEGGPGARTPVSFQYLINEIDHGWYTGCALLRSLQDILTVRAGRRASLALAAVLPLPAPRTIGGDGRVGGGGGGSGGGGGGVIVPRGRRRNERDGGGHSQPPSHPTALYT